MTGPVLGEAGHIKRDKNHYAVILVLPRGGGEFCRHRVGLYMRVSLCRKHSTRPSFSRVSSCLSGKASSFTSVQVLRVVSFPSMSNAKEK
jgi:hypothetical protein